MEMMGDKDISELFSNIQKLIKSASEALSAGDTEASMKSLNKANVTANYGKAAMLYKASIDE